jgi:hypothetical protein
MTRIDPLKIKAMMDESKAIAEKLMALKSQGQNKHPTKGSATGQLHSPSPQSRQIKSALMIF